MTYPRFAVLLLALLALATSACQLPPFLPGVPGQHFGPRQQLHRRHRDG